MNPTDKTASTAGSSGTGRAKLRQVAEASLVPSSVPHFKSFDHLTDARVRRAKDYEQYLCASLDRFPEFAARIETEIAWARSEQQRSKPSDRERIHRVLEENRGGLLCDEVADDTGLPYSTCYKHLRAMLDSGLVAATSRPGISANKPMLIWSLAH